MYKKKTFLAIIPARGGSKRLPKKNILNLNRKPLIAWSIKAGLKSTYIDKVIVSSDKDYILKIAKNYGAQTIKRPKQLASDTSKIFYTIHHALLNLRKYDYIVLLQPTSPLRNEKHIDDAIKFLTAKKADAVIGVCETDHSPLWSSTLPDDRSLVNFRQKKAKDKRSQDLEKYFRINGAIYICKTEKFLKEKGFFIKKNIFAFIMDRESSIDIDERIDFLFAEFLIKLIKS
ncbi:cytidylyltransferase domain-containing protein [Candidatus Pelagibacter bacterium nBUS_49]|uniref:acylneuraminate cytidylyltransferase family protein n=1 Tax=Candidatus Pelagibacter bacterium nBUS_49 TaxID=3374196 RepID=UPI003EBEA7FD